MTAPTLEQARAAKAALAAALTRSGGVAGVGIARGPDGEWVVRVALTGDEPAPALPERVEGVRITSAVVGRAKPLT